MDKAEKHRVLTVLARKYNNSFEKIYEAVKRKEPITKEELQDAANWLKESGLKTVAITDLDYPEVLRNVLEPPLIIFYKGDNLLNEKILSVVGSKHNIPMDEIDDTCLYLNDETIVEKNGTRKMDLNPDVSPGNDRLLKYKVATNLYIGRDISQTEMAGALDGIMLMLYWGREMRDILVEYQEGLNESLLKDGATLVISSLTDLPPTDHLS